MVVAARSASARAALTMWRASRRVWHSPC